MAAAAIHRPRRQPTGPRALLGIGVDVGLRQEASGICVVEAEWEGDACHFNVRHLERLPPGTTYPDLAARVAEIHINLKARLDHHCDAWIYVDLTGHGAPIRDEIIEATEQDIYEVRFNHGDLRRVDPDNSWSITYGKALLVSRVTLLLQKGRLHLPDTEQARTLAEELLDYRVEVHKDANEHYGDFKVGTRDELVTALGLAVQEDLGWGPIGGLDFDLQTCLKKWGSSW